MDDFKHIVAENIIKLRTSYGLTQAQLGEKLNYSDKSVSKWERGEALPDVYVLKQISEMFNVTVDFLLVDHSSEKVSVKKPFHRYSRRMISLIAILGVWAAAILAFVILWMSGIVLSLIFVYTVPISLIVLLVLNSIWGNRKNNLYIISGIVWGIICSVYLTAIDKNWWQLFILGVPAQIIIVLSFFIKRKTDKN